MRHVGYSDRYNGITWQLIDIKIEVISLILFILIVKRLWEYKTPIEVR